MCDPLTIITAISAVAGGVQAANAPKPPGPKAAPTADALDDTGADVVLGGDRTEDATTDDAATEATLTKQTGSTIKTSKKTGINIL